MTELPPDWVRRLLSDVARRLTRKNSEANDNVLTISAQRGLVSQERYFKKRVASKDLSGYFLLNRGDFAYNKSYSSGYPFGAVKRLTEDARGVVSPLYICFELLKDSGVASDYLVQYFESGLFDRALGSVAQQGARNHGLLNVKPAEFFALEIILPPLTEQLKIASILSSVDEVIEKTEGVIEQLQFVKNSTMQELVTRGLPGRHTRFKMTEIGEIPEGWEVVTVADIPPDDRACAQTGPFGQQLGTNDFTSAGTPVLKIGNVRWGSIDLSDLDHVSEKKARELARFAVREGDLLFARQGATTGRNALADSRCAGALINYHIIRVAVDRTRCDPRFLSICFNSTLVQDQVGRDKQRGNRDGINTRQILSFKFPLPGLVEQRAISESIDSIVAAANAHHGELAQLRATKAALMSVLLTGELPVTPDGAPA